MSITPRLTEEMLARRKTHALELEKQMAEQAQQKNRAEFNQALEHNAMVINNLFELVLQNHPKLGVKFNIRPGNGTEEQDNLKLAVIQAAAMQLTMNHGKLKEQELNDAQCLNSLVVGLVKTMVVNHTLNNHPEIQTMLEEQQKLLNNFAHGLPKVNNFEEQMKLEEFKKLMLDKAPQQELNKALDGLKDETLKNLKEPLNRLFKETEALTHKMLEKMGEDIQKTVDLQMKKNFPQLKPGGSTRAAGNSVEENAELRENPFANLTGLSSSLPGCIPITISTNIGNGLGLITALRGSISTSRENVDTGHTQQTQLTGQVAGFEGEEEGITAFEPDSADKFAASTKKSRLPNPFSTKLSRDKT